MRVTSNDDSFFDELGVIKEKYCVDDDDLEDGSDEVTANADAGLGLPVMNFAQPGKKNTKLETVGVGLPTF